MTAIFISLAVGVLTFCFGMLGHYLHRLLPERHMSTGSKEMIGGIIGLVSLLLALVLGTLVGSAYGFCAAQKANIETLCARALELDLTDVRNLWPYLDHGPRTVAAPHCADGNSGALPESGS